MESPLIGVSPGIRRVRELIERLASSSLHLLIVGETGTGKELVAQNLHQRSGRRGPLVPINCSVLPREMADSLLFGHRRGAFSGAVETRSGHFRCADGGTLFLDELLSLPIETQPKLLRALEAGEVHPLGEDRRVRVDVRVIAAAQESGTDAVRRGSLRRDLYQRLVGGVIALPPLRERMEDLGPLAEYFAGLEGRRLAPGAVALLQNYTWPGNVRELRLTIERAGRFVSNGTLPPGALAEALAASEPERTSATRPALWHLIPLERLIRTCREHRWSADPTAHALGVSRATLFRNLRAYSISLPAARRADRESHGSHETLATP